MKHPNPRIQQNQTEFLEKCPADQRDFHARMFRTGNAAIRYHEEAQSEHEATREDFDDWLSGLPDNIRRHMEAEGFENCRTNFSFTRHVMERRDIGMDVWMQEHLSPEDYEHWRTAARHNIDAQHPLGAASSRSTD